MEDVNEEWRSRDAKRKSMFSGECVKFGILKKSRSSRRRSLCNQSVYLELNCHYLKYYKLPHGWLSFISSRQQNLDQVQKRVKRLGKPTACIDLQLVDIEYQLYDKSFRLVSLMSLDFIELQAESLDHAIEWMSAIKELKREVNAAQNRRSRRSTLFIPRKTSKPVLPSLLTTYAKILQVSAFHRADARRVIRDIENFESFFILSFNVLANTYVENNTRSPDLYQHCDTSCLPWTFRKKLILEHLVDSNATIICLQECERSFFNDLLLILTSYDGYIDCNTRLDAELPGTATFFKKDCFAWTWQERSYRTLLIGLRVLKGLEIGNVLAVANSHLEGAPWKTKDRAAQMKGVFNKLDRKEADHKFVVCVGDYNDGSRSDLCQKVMPGRSFYSCYDNHPSRDVTCLLLPGNSKEYDIEQGRVDHIFSDQRLQLQALMHVMEAEWSRELVIETGLPSLVWPSDHLSVGAVLRFNSDPAAFLKVAKIVKNVFDSKSAQEMLEADECPLTAEEKKCWLDNFDASLKAFPGKPPEEELTRIKTIQALRNEFIGTLSQDSQEFIKKYTTKKKHELKQEKKNEKT